VGQQTEVISVSVVPDDGAYLVVDNRLANKPGSGDGKGFGGIPFLAWGAVKDRGNAGRPIVNINNGVIRPTVSFDAELLLNPTDSDSFQILHFIVSAEWFDASVGKVIPHQIQVRWGWSGAHTHPPISPLGRVWNWNLEESYFNPGASIGFFSTQNIHQTCPELKSDFPTLFNSTETPIGTKKHYTVDIEGLFWCASNRGLFTAPMPNEELEVNIVQWSVELTYANSFLGVKISNMETGNL
jgi:hypothetical protein